MAPLLQLSFEQLIRRPECTCLQMQNIERSVWRHSREHHQSPSGSCSIPTQSMWNHAPRWQSALEHLIMVTSDRSVANTAKCKGKGMYTWYSASSRNTTSDALKYGTCSQGISQFYLHIHTFIYNRNEPYLLLPSQPQLVLIYRRRRDGRLNRPRCKVTPAEIRTCNLLVTSPALYRTATSARRSTRFRQCTRVRPESTILVLGLDYKGLALGLGHGP